MSAYGWRRSRSQEPVNLVAIFAHYGVTVREGYSVPVRCILHDDRHASATANTDKGLWYCHTCSVGGDGIKLIMLREGVGYKDAVTRAAAILDGHSEQVGRQPGHRVGRPARRTWNF